MEDPEELLELGQKHMERMQAETTLTIKAVDLKTVGADVDGIRLGDTVKLVSAPHKLNKEDVCTKIELDIEKPEKSEYTFGLPVESLTDSNASAKRKNRRSSDHMHRWLTETENAFNVFVEAAGAQINLNATHINEMGERVSDAEIRIDGQEKTIEAKADKIELQGYVTMEDFEAVEGWATDFSGESISGSSIVGGYGDFDELVCGQLLVGGDSLHKTSITVVTGIDVKTSLEGQITAVQPVTTQFYYYT